MFAEIAGLDLAAVLQLDRCNVGTHRADVVGGGFGQQRAGLVDAAPMRNRKQVADAVLASLGSQRPGGGGAQPPVEMGYDELEALPVDQQMKILEERINKAGGFSALP